MSVEGELQGGRYRVGRTLGGQPHVRLGVHVDSGAEVVLKRATFPESHEQLLREGRLLQRLSHPRLRGLVDICLDGVSPVLVLEYRRGPDVLAWCRGGELVPRACKAIRSLLPLLSYLHGRGIVHRDLKAQHLLVEMGEGQPQLVLLDLGLAGEGPLGVAGTRGYMAPEVAAGEGATPATDRYAIGALFHELLSGDPVRLLSHELRPRPEGVPSALWELTTDLLAPEPERRPSLEAMDEVLAHLLSQPRLVAQPRWSGLPKLQSVAQQDVLSALADGLAEGQGGLFELRGALPPRALEALAELAALSGCAVHRVDGARALAAGLGAELQGLSRDGAAHRLVEALLDRESPMALLVERCDELTAATLEKLARVMHGRPGHGLEAAVVWGPDVAMPGLVAEVAMVVELPPLSPQEVHSLVSAVTAIDPPPPWATALAEGCAGDPRRILAALRAQHAAEALDARELSETAVAALGVESAVAGLDDAGRWLLAIISLSPFPLEPSLLHEVAAEVDPGSGSRGAGALASLEARELVLVDHRGVSLALGRGAELRRLVRGVLSEAQRREVHGALARALEEGAEVPEALARLAHHQLRGGSLAAAAESMRRAGAAASEDAEACLRAAHGAGVALPPQTRGALRARAAHRLRSQGDLDGALALARGAGAAGGEADLALEVTLLSDSGRPAEALEVLTTAWDPRDPELGLLSARAKILLGDVSGAAADARRGLRQGPAPELRPQLDNVLGLALFYGGEVDDACAVLESSLARGARFSPLPEEALARIENSLGMLYQQLERLDDAQQSYASALARFRRLGDPSRGATCALNLGTVTHQRGLLGNALAAYRGAQELAQRTVTEGEGGATASRIEATWALANEGNLLSDLGAFEQADVVLEVANQRAAAHGSGSLQGHVALYQADLARLRGELEAADELLAEARSCFEERDARGRFEAALLAGELALARGDGQAGAAALRELEARPSAQRRADASTLWLAARLQRLPGGSERRAADLVERALALGATKPPRFVLAAAGAELANRLGVSERATELAEAYREGLQERRRAVPPQHRQSFDEHPQTVAAGSALAALGPEGAGPAPAGITRLLEINRELNQRLPLDELLARILDGAIELSGAERGFVLLLGGLQRRGSKLRLVAARTLEGERLRRGLTQLSTSIAEEAMSSGATVVVADARGDERFRSRLSVSGLELRAVLCVPLRASGELRGALYLDNRFRRDVFGPPTVALAEAFAEQAGIALENARLLEEATRRGEQLAAAKAELLTLNQRLEDELAQKSVALSEMRVRLDHQEEELVRRFNAANIVGRSKPMRALFGKLERMARVDLPVVIHGESGTGKELVARALHRQSARASAPFVAVNCGAIPASLLESELFGYARGAFTGAVRDRPGMFEVAGEGTLFLDEVGDMDAEMQVKLLRILQEGTFRRLGEERERRSACRVVSASHRSLDDLVAEGRFREDLYYRLHVLRLDVPALRERRDDIPLLVEHLLKRIERQRDGAVTMSKAALRALVDHDWPGNVRELENELSRAALLGEGRLELGDLSPRVVGERQGAHRGTAGAVGSGNLKAALADHERELIEAALEAHEGNVTRAAEALGLHRVALHRKLKTLGIAAQRRRGDENV